MFDELFKVSLVIDLLEHLDESLLVLVVDDVQGLKLSLVSRDDY